MTEPTLTPDEYFEMSREAKSNADRCQMHTQGYTANMRAAQLYATWALYQLQRQTTPL